MGAETETLDDTTDPLTEPGEPEPPRRRSRRRTVLSWVITVVVALLISTGTRAYAVQSYYVPTPSMSPTLLPGDRILVDKLSSTVHRGDIVVFRNPPADKGGPPTLVKRVIGLPGERISSIGDEVLVNGNVLPEPWLPRLQGACAEPSEHITPTVIPPNHYFVMGDCRGDSDDSRYWGTVPGSDIIGKVDVIMWRSGHPWLHWF
ncbi:MAG TPA: signal peptidase I [Acidimicrobiales bacterium]|nr:signal peptidase I [Acidimicrobiales bacterium]